MGKMDHRLYLFNSMNGDKFIQEILNSIRYHMGMEVAFIARFTDDKRLIEFTATEQSVTEPSLHPHDSSPKKESYCQKIVDGDLPNIIPDTSKNSVTRSLSVTKALNIGAYIGVPIFIDGSQLYGTLCCYNQSPHKDLQDSHSAFLNVMADFIGQIFKRRLGNAVLQYEAREQVELVLAERRVSIAYQEINSTKKQPVRHFEALARFNTTPYLPPNVWLDKAESVGLSDAVESLIIKQVLSELTHLKKEFGECRVSINATPALISSGTLAQLLGEASPKDLIIEVTEHSEIEDYTLFAEALAPLIELGFKVAIDDVGAGFSSLRHILELNASIIKLDMSLVSNIDQDNKKQSLVAALITFGQMSDLTIIAEGVETETEYNQLKRLGIEYFQGFYFSRPTALAFLECT